MQDIHYFNPTKLSINQKKYYEQKISECLKVIQPIALKHFNFKNVKQLRDLYLSQKNVLSNFLEVEKSMNWLIDHEEIIISAYIGMMKAICSDLSCLNKYSGATLKDYLQVASIGIYEAIYQYNGNTKFSTFSFCVAKNKLLTFHRSELTSVGINKKVLKFKNEIKNLMENGDSYNSAVSKIENVDYNLINRLNNVFQIDDCENCFEIPDKDQKNTDQLEIEEMKKVIYNTKLTKIERDLINAYLNGDENYRKVVSQTVVNPKTGKNWTKQRLSQIFISACNKIQQNYSQLLYKNVI
jgi:DNA-directed RNA polymerase specialized sigma24 family protein